LEGGAVRRPAAGLIVVAVLLLSALAPPARAARGVRFSVRPTLGPPTTVTVATGSGFGTSETVTVSFDALVVATVTASRGAFTANVTIPATATPGSHTIQARGGTTGTVASAPFVVRTDWTQFHFNLARSGYNPFESLIAPANAASLVVRQRIATGGPVGAPAIECGGRVVIGSDVGTLLGIDPSSGSVAWSVALGSPIVASVTAAPISPCTVVATTSGGIVAAVNAGTGALLWQFTLGAGVVASALMSPGGQPSNFKVYVGAQNGVVSAFAETGALNFSTQLSGAITQPAAFLGIPHQGAQLFVGTDLGRLYSVDPTRGSVLRSTTLDGAVTAGPAIGDLGSGTAILVGTAAGTLYSLDPTDLHVRWTLPLGATPVATPAIGDPAPVGARTGRSLALVGSADGTLRAIAEEAGAPVTAWATPLAAAASTSPALANGLVVVGSDDGVLHVIEASTGVELSAADLEVARSSPIVVDGLIIVGTTGGDVVLLGP
jgi:outer membrane protein assembly factor BamB